MKASRENRLSHYRFNRQGIVRSLAAALLSMRLSIVVPLLYMGLILAGASIPAENGEAEEKHYLHFLLLPSLLQNLMHIPAYGLLAFFWRWCLDAYVQAKTAVVLALVLTIGFGVAQEWYQTFIPGRYGSASDVVFDALGAFMGVWIFAGLKRRMHPRFQGQGIQQKKDDQVA